MKGILKESKRLVVKNPLIYTQLTLTFKIILIELQKCMKNRKNQPIEPTKTIGKKTSAEAGGKRRK